LNKKLYKFTLTDVFATNFLPCVKRQAKQTQVQWGDVYDRLLIDSDINNILCRSKEIELLKELLLTPPQIKIFDFLNTRFVPIPKPQNIQPVTQTPMIQIRTHLGHRRNVDSDGNEVAQQQELFYPYCSIMKDPHDPMNKRLLHKLEPDVVEVLSRFHEKMLIANLNQVTMQQSQWKDNENDEDNVKDRNDVNDKKDENKVDISELKSLNRVSENLNTEEIIDESIILDEKQRSEKLKMKKISFVTFGNFGPLKSKKELLRGKVHNIS